MKRWMHSGAMLSAAAIFAAFPASLSAADAQKALTGCLESTTDGYTLTAAGRRLELNGDADFAKHAGHTVKVTGQQDGDSFTVASLEHVSPQCHSSMTAAPADAGTSVEDRASQGPTAQDQGGSKADRETTAKIRKAVVDDDTLSVYAHNVKIITRDGRVTLRGPVRSTAEKASVAAKAEAVIGDAVDNQLTVEPESK
jgi:osmotically-inducible protein OsmY